MADRLEGGALHLPDDIPANQYVTFKGGKASASRGIGLTIGEGLERFQPDALRYALAAAFPEQADTEISEEQIGARINEELVATWGNLDQSGADHGQQELRRSRSRHPGAR